jgi:predicted metal-dependent phosphoesterase TrpH
MPAGQPFTQLCRALARHRPGARVDLHMHTTCSDGLYSPEQIVDLARRSGMPAIAITDHDSFAALEPARRHAGTRLQVIAGVEISTEFEGRELHLLGYFFDPSHSELNAALERLRQGRRHRFFAMADRLRQLGVNLGDDGLHNAAACGAVGRRHLAQLMVKERKSATIREAFVRYLGDSGKAVVPKQRLAVADAIALVSAAGGVSAWAHPGDDCTWDSLRELYNLGMRAIEVDWPSAKVTRSRVLRRWAKALAMATTAGSDCHGPDEPKRSLGARGIDLNELDYLQQMKPHQSPV